MLQKRMKAAGIAPGVKSSQPPSNRVVSAAASNRINTHKPKNNSSYFNSPASKSNASLSSPYRPASNNVSARGGGVQYGNKRPAPIQYEAEAKRPRLDVYHPSPPDLNAQEGMEISAAEPIASSSPKYHQLYPMLPDNTHGEQGFEPKQPPSQISERLSPVRRSKQQIPPLQQTPTPNLLPNESSISLSPPSPSTPSSRQEAGGGLMAAVTGFIGAGVKKLVHIASPRRPIRSNKMVPRIRKSSDLSGSSSSSIGSSSISIGEADALNLSLPQTPRYEPEVTEKSTRRPTGYDWELLPSDVDICKKADGTLWRLGKGGFGEVFKGLKDSVDEVAVKVIRIQSTPVAIDQFKQEIDIISKLRHRHILQFYGACVQSNCLYMVTELMQTDLFSSLRTDLRYMWTGIYGKEVLLGVAAGLHYLHSRRPPIVHRDIKSPNILLMDGISKIADVGIARTKSDSDMTAQKGYTIAWAAPEVVYRKRATEKIDIWSFGVVMWEVVSGKLPRVGHLVLPSEAPPPLRTLYTMCVDEDANKRPSAAQAITQLKAIK